MTFEVGDYVEFYREATDAEWSSVGKITMRISLGDRVYITNVSRGSNKCVTVSFKKEEGSVMGWYPKECFRKVDTDPEFKFLL